MSRNSIYCYVVEGPCERNLIQSIKNKYLLSGSIKIKNVLTEELTDNFMRVLSPNTICVLIFDSDVFLNKGPEIPKIDKKVILKNIKNIRNSQNVKEVIVICQTKNLEEELIFSTTLKKWQDFFDEKHLEEHKKRFSNCRNLLQILERNNFDVSKIWSRENLSFLSEKNDSKKIKIMQKVKK